VRCETHRHLLRSVIMQLAAAKTLSQPVSRSPAFSPRPRTLTSSRLFHLLYSCSLILLADTWWLGQGAHGCACDVHSPSVNAAMHSGAPLRRAVAASAAAAAQPLLAHTHTVAGASVSHESSRLQVFTPPYCALHAEHCQSVPSECGREE